MAVGGKVNPYAELEAIYKTLPTISCAGHCQNSCGPWLLSGMEAKRIENRFGEFGVVNSKNVCPMLNRSTGQCSVYHIRPLVCRLWGVVESMPCKFGCVPSPRYLTHAEGIKLLREVHAISDRLGYGDNVTTSRDPMRVMLQVAMEQGR